MTALDRRVAGRHEGERRKSAAHALLTAHRDVYLRRARRALLTRLLSHDEATADDVADALDVSYGRDVHNYYGSVAPGWAVAV
jgi:hypothetical protein